MNIPDKLSAAEHLAIRNELIKGLADLDARLSWLAKQEPSNRIVAEFRELVALRAELADDLTSLNGQAAPMPLLKEQM